MRRGGPADPVPPVAQRRRRQRGRCGCGGWFALLSSPSVCCVVTLASLQLTRAIGAPCSSLRSCPGLLRPGRPPGEPAGGNAAGGSGCGCRAARRRGAGRLVPCGRMSLERAGVDEPDRSSPLYRKRLGRAYETMKSGGGRPWFGEGGPQWSQVACNQSECGVWHYQAPDRCKPYRRCAHMRPLDPCGRRRTALPPRIRRRRPRLTDNRATRATTSEPASLATGSRVCRPPSARPSQRRPLACVALSRRDRDQGRERQPRSARRRSSVPAAG